MTVKTLEWPDALDWLVAQLNRPINVIVSGPSGVLVDGPMWLTRGVDCLPGEVPTVLWLSMEGGLSTEPLRLWINARQVERMSIDEIDDTLTIAFRGYEEYRLRPIDDLA